MEMWFGNCTKHNLDLINFFELELSGFESSRIDDGYYSEATMKTFYRWISGFKIPKAISSKRKVHY